MKPRVVRTIRRASLELVHQLGEMGVATVHEAQGRSGLMRPYMRPIYPKARVAGTALTVSCHPGDNMMIHAALSVCRVGDVLVVAPVSDSTDGMFGDLLAVSAQAHGVLGLVIDAGVRDTADLEEMKFPVWARAIHSQGTVKATPGSVNVDVVCAGALVRPGDAIIGDRDGVVVVPRERVDEVCVLSQERIAKEERTRERLRAGELGFDFYGMKDKLKGLGVEFEGE
jgi:4-hydroxy-4-methyl-2-oxoglutarate aldolase